MLSPKAMNRVAEMRGTFTTLTGNPHDAVCFFASWAVQATLVGPTLKRLPLGGVHVVDNTPSPPLTAGFG